MAEMNANEDNFAAAFEKLAEMAENPEAAAATLVSPDPTPPAATPELAATTSAESPASPDEPVDEQEESSEEAEGAEADDSEETEEEQTSSSAISDQELLQRFAQLVKSAETPTATSTPQSIPVAQPIQTPEIFSKEEQELLQSYEKDWPEVAKAEMLRRRAEYRDLVGYIFQEVAKEFSPMMDAVRSISERTHLTDLQSTVSDYDDVRDKVVDWVSKQPPYLQSAYNHVIQQGTVDEVVDLINRYKQDVGVTAPRPAPKSKAETELPTATKQAAAALAPVSSKRSAVSAGIDPNDFESAFASFADKL